jgi:hypothetical protein
MRSNIFKIDFQENRRFTNRLFFKPEIVKVTQNGDHSLAADALKQKRDHFRAKKNIF